MQCVYIKSAAADPFIREQTTRILALKPRFRLLFINTEQDEPNTKTIELRPTTNPLLAKSNA